MANIKKFEDFVSEMDRAKEIEGDIVDMGTPDVKSEEEAEEEAEEVQGMHESDDVVSGEVDGAVPLKQIGKPVSEMLEACYEAALNEAKTWAEDAHDDHTVETYMAENASLVAGLAVSALSEMKGDMETEAYEACLNKMSESYAKKINEYKEMKNATDAEDVE